jgi:hypothetical protein
VSKVGYPLNFERRREGLKIYFWSAALFYTIDNQMVVKKKLILKHFLPDKKCNKGEEWAVYMAILTAAKHLMRPIKQTLITQTKERLMQPS